MHSRLSKIADDVASRSGTKGLSVTVDISLSPIQHEDSEALFALADSQRPYLGQWLPWVEYTQAVTDTQNFIALCQQQYQAGTDVVFTIRYQSSMVGCIGLNDINWDQGQATIGYWLSEQCQGKGVITQSVKFLARYINAMFELQELNIFCNRKNTPSRSVAERAGFGRVELPTVLSAAISAEIAEGESFVLYQRRF